MAKPTGIALHNLSVNLLPEVDYDSSISNIKVQIIGVLARIEKV